MRRRRRAPNGDSLARALLHGRAEGILKRLLGQIKITQEANQRGKDAARFGAIDRFDFG